MKWSFFFTSAIGKKIVMALTGLFLISFLIVHVGINATIWSNDNGEMFNKAAHFMGSTIVIRIIEIGLFLFFIIHMIQGWQLEVQNRRRRARLSNTAGRARQQMVQPFHGHAGYAFVPVPGDAYFAFLGAIAYYRQPARSNYTAAPKHITCFANAGSFSKPHSGDIVCTGLHFAVVSPDAWLSERFRTMGVHNRKYLAMLKSIGYGFAIIVSLAFAMMPISMYLGWVK